MFIDFWSKIDELDILYLALSLRSLDISRKQNDVHISRTKLSGILLTVETQRSISTMVPIRTVSWLNIGSYEIFVPYKDSQARVIINPVRSIIFDAHKRLFLDERGEAAAPIEGKVGLNRRFLRQFTALWAIIVRLL